MRFGFVTCVQLGLSCLEAIRDLGAEPDLLLTLRDDRAVRKSGRIWLDEFAAAGNNLLVKVGNINDEDARAAIVDADLDWLFVIGWSQIVGDEVLALPRHGCVGMHPTLLPQGRGRAPIPWAIIKGLSQTGVTMFVLDNGVDTGPVIGQEAVTITPDETATTLYSKIDDLHVQLVRETWAAFGSETVAPVPQEEVRASVWPGRRPEDGELSSAMSVLEMDRHVRALTSPYPGAWWRDDHDTTWIVDSGSTAPTPDDALEIPASDGKYYVRTCREAAGHP